MEKFIGCIAKYSGGEIKYYPGFHSVQKPQEVERFENDLRRYLQRKIGFEAVMRLRISPGKDYHSAEIIFN
jgi:protein transport protein SEC24